MEYLVRWGAFSEWGMFENAIFRSELAPVLMRYLYETYSFWLPNVYVKYLECMFKKSKARKVFEICNIIHIIEMHKLGGEGTFSERGIFENRLCHSAVAPVLTMYCTSDHLVVIDYQINVGHVYNTCLRQTKSLTLFQICIMIHINEIHMLTRGGGISRMGDVWERNMPFWGCPRSHDVALWTVYWWPNLCCTYLECTLDTIRS